MVHTVSLGLVLAGTWLLLSAHLEPALLILGTVSVVVVLVICRRMDLIDHEGHPVHLAGRGMVYWPWLAVEIVKAAIDVSRRILHPRMPISPTLIRVTADQTSAVGLVTYANSITLTPGTIAIAIADGEILVHALTREGAAALAEGEMSRRVKRLEQG